MRSKNTYAEKLLDPRWQKLRLEVFQRDNFTCQACGDSKSTLHAHHVLYSPESEGPWDYAIHEIQTLCADCHKEEHESAKVARLALSSVLAQNGFGLSYRIEQLATALSYYADAKSVFDEAAEQEKQNVCRILFGE